MRFRRSSGRATSRSIALIVEVVLAVGLLALLIAITSGLYTYELNRLKTQQATDMLATFDRSVRVYAEVCGEWPPGSQDSSLRRILPLLLSVPETREVLSNVSNVLLYTVDGIPRCRDPWGQPIRCLTRRSSSKAFRDRVILNDGAPVFECAGPDRRFGDTDTSRQADNIRTDEPLSVTPPTTQPVTTDDEPGTT